MTALAEKQEHKQDNGVRFLNDNTFPFGAYFQPIPGHEEVAIEALKAADINVVCIGKFAWDLHENGDGSLDLSRYVAVVKEFEAAGISVILTPPLALPPRWLTERCPDLLAEDQLFESQRKLVRFASPSFLEWSEKLLREASEAFKDCKNVVGWILDNALFGKLATDHSTSTQEAFQGFLRDRYEGDIGALNAAWGAPRKLASYQNFEQIDIREVRRQRAGGAIVDYHCFLSARTAEIYQRQAQQVHEAHTEWWVACRGMLHGIDNHALGKVSSAMAFTHDMTLGSDASKHSEHFGAYAEMRSVSGNFLLAEASYFHNPLPTPFKAKELRLYTYQAIANGCDGILLPQEMARCSETLSTQKRELAALAPYILGTTNKADVAVIHDMADSLWAQLPYEESLPSHLEVGKAFLSMLSEQGYACSAVNPLADLSAYKLVVVPSTLFLSCESVRNLEEYAKAGGCLLITANAGRCDSHGNFLEEGPGTLTSVLEHLIGAKVEQHLLTSEEQSSAVHTDFGKIFGSHWIESLIPQTCQTHGTWSDGILRDRSALTSNRFGAGRVFYLGTYPSESSLDLLLPFVAEQAKLKPLAYHMDPDLEVTIRKGKDYFLQKE